MVLPFAKTVLQASIIRHPLEYVHQQVLTFQVLRHHAYIWTGDMFIPAMKLETEGAEGETETAA
jgi:hypothetical protein